jgi:hypothetical protein
VENGAKEGKEKTQVQGTQFVNLPAEPVFGTASCEKNQLINLSSNASANGTEPLLNNTMHSVMSCDSHKSTSQSVSQSSVSIEHATIMGLKEIKATQGKTIGKLQARVAYLEVELSKKDISLDKLQKVEADNKVMKNTVTKQKKEINKMSNRVDDLVRRNATMKKEISRLTERNQELQKEIDKEKENEERLNTTTEVNQRNKEPEERNDEWQTVGKSKGQKKKKDKRPSDKRPSDKNPVILDNDTRQYRIPVIGGGQSNHGNINKKSHQPNESKKQVKIVVSGDANTRGLGPLIQSKTVEGLATVRSGFKVQDLNNHLDKDVTTETDIVFVNVGASNLGVEPLVNTICAFDKLLDKMSSYKYSAILAVPPNPRYQRKVDDLNCYLKCKCESLEGVGFVDTKLHHSDMAPKGGLLNPKGQKKVASSILKYAESYV